MKVTVNKGTCTVTREPSDKRFTSGGWSDAESTFLYHVKQELNKQGYDLIKKRMWRDGHMVDDHQQYIRARKPTGDPNKDVYLLNGRYSIEDAGEVFNRDGEVDLMLITDIFTDTMHAI